MHLLDVLNYKEIINDFKVKQKNGFGLERYLKRNAEYDERNGLARTYLIFDGITNELVAYFSIKAGNITANERKGLLSNIIEFDSVPGVELANFAINGAYKEKHSYVKEIGRIVLMDFVFPIIREVVKVVGMKVIYIFALPNVKLIERYEELGFIRLPAKQEKAIHKRIKPSYDRNCIFMYQVLS